MSSDLRTFREIWRDLKAADQAAFIDDDPEIQARVAKRICFDQESAAKSIVQLDPSLATQVRNIGTKVDTRRSRAVRDFLMLTGMGYETECVELMLCDEHQITADALRRGYKNKDPGIFDDGDKQRKAMAKTGKAAKHLEYLVRKITP